MNASGAYRGRILLGSFFGVTCGYSSTYFYSSGLFLIPVSRDLGLTRGQVSLANLGNFFLIAALAPLLGRAVDRFGARSVGILSLLGLAVAFLLCAWLTSGLWTLVGTSLLIALLGGGSSSVSFSRLVVDAFDRRRGMALAFMQTGAGVGAFLIPLILSTDLNASDWRAAYRTLAYIVLAAALVVALLIHATPIAGTSAIRSSKAVNDVGGRDVWKMRAFRMLAAAFFLAGAALAGAVVHFVPMMIDGGVSSAQAAKLASVLGVALICGRLLIGLLLDRFVPEIVAATVLLVTSVGLTVLAFAGAAIGVVGAIFVGAGIGSEVDLLSYLTARHFPRERYGTAYGGTFGVFLFGSATGPALIGFLFDRTGSYRSGYLLAALFLISAAMFAARLRHLYFPSIDPIPAAARSTARCQQ